MDGDAKFQTYSAGTPCYFGVHSGTWSGKFSFPLLNKKIVLNTTAEIEDKCWIRIKVRELAYAIPSDE